MRKKSETQDQGTEGEAAVNHPMPHSGGSYTRLPDGSLVENKPEAEDDAPAAETASE